MITEVAKTTVLAGLNANGVIPFGSLIGQVIWKMGKIILEEKSQKKILPYMSTLLQIILAILGNGRGSGIDLDGVSVPRPKGKPPVLPGQAAKNIPRS